MPAARADIFLALLGGAISEQSQAFVSKPRLSPGYLSYVWGLSQVIGRKALALSDYRGKVHRFFTPGLVTVLNASDDLSRADGNRRACDTVVSGPPPCRRQGRPGSPPGTSRAGVVSTSAGTAGLVPRRQCW